MRAGWLVLGLAGLVGGCDPRDFDEAVARAPVRSLEAPDGFGAADMGRVVLPLRPPRGRPGVSARLLAMGAQQGSLAYFEIDPAGKARGRSVNDPTVKDLLIDASAPAASAVLLENDKVLLGAPDFGVNQLVNMGVGRTLLLEVQQPDDGQTTFAMSRQIEIDPARPEQQTRRFGSGLAVGHVSGGPEQDHVVVSEDKVALMEDGQRLFFSDLAPCSIRLEGLPAAYSFRAVATGDLLATPGDEIVVGVPRSAGRGSVAVAGKMGSGLACLLTLSPMSSPARFGAALAVADLDGDGQRDLVVGAPPDSVMIYLGPLAEMKEPARVLQPPGLAPGAPSGEFGLRVAVLDADGMPGLEIAVGAPDMAVGGKVGAGQVFLFKPDGKLVATLADDSPGERAGFGISLAALPFLTPVCDGRPAREVPILLVGAEENLFLHFRFPGSGTDPRCFDLK